MDVELLTSAADPVTGVLPRFQALPSVTNVTLLGHSDGATRVEVHMEKGADIRAAVFHLAVAEGWVLLEMHRRGTTLEEVFHKLTTT
jgi:hypothetical protein